MTASNLMDGRAVAESVHAETAARVVALKARGVVPKLVFIRVGEDPASQVYVGMKERMSAKVGVDSTTHVVPADTAEAALLAFLERLNADPAVHGILVQAPLPSHISQARVYSTVAPSKDVDGFHPVNAGKLMLGEGGGFVPCTPAGVHELLKRYEVPTAGARVVILGRGNIVGKPMMSILVQKGAYADATVTVCHSRTRDIAGHCREADILIAALGSPEFVKRDMVKPGAVVVDVGVNRIPDPTAKTGTRLVGDVAFAEVQPVARWITPNPGGVGPMTIAMLLRNTVEAAERAVS